MSKIKGINLRLNYHNLSDPNAEFRFVGQDGPTNASVLDHESIEVISIFGSTLDDFILQSEQENLRYIILNKESVTEIAYPFLSNIYDNEGEYKYLNKIIDTNELGFTKFKVKVFEIDYIKFHALNP